MDTNRGNVTQRNVPQVKKANNSHIINIGGLHIHSFDDNYTLFQISTLDLTLSHSASFCKFQFCLIHVLLVDKR